VAREAIIIDESVAAGSTQFKALPAGWYHVEIEEVEERESKSAKNAGKPMYNYKMKVVGGDHDGRKFFVTACLWKEAIFTQVDIQKALGIPLAEAEDGKVRFEIAEEDDLIGKELKVRLKVKDKYVKPGEEAELDEEGKPLKDNEANGFKSLDSVSPGAAKAKAKGTKKSADGEFDL
jgi:hypothetical protein